MRYALKADGRYNVELSEQLGFRWGWAEKGDENGEGGSKTFWVGEFYICATPQYILVFSQKYKVIALALLEFCSNKTLYPSQLNSKQSHKRLHIYPLQLPTKPV